jgi:hypothetical protein
MSKYSRQPGDSILALLEPGEYVLNRNAVDEIGKENLDELNYEDAPRFDMSQRGQFQAGGMLGDMIGMQAGGDTLSYGGATTEVQSLDDIYKKMGMQPKSQQIEGFEEQYAYDPSREGVIFEDYGRAIQGATQSGQQNLMSSGQEMRQSQAKSGFAGGGAGQQAQQQARGTIMRDFLAQEGAAKSSLFKGVRGERESWMTDVGAGLSRLQGQEGTEDYGGGSDGSGGTITTSVRENYDPNAAGPPGWPSIGIYDSWVTAGSDPNTMVNFGYQAPAAGTSTQRTSTTGQTGCFLSGTKVDIIDGDISIEDLQIGDEVKTYDLKNSKQKKSKVTETYKHNVDGYLIINDIIKTTPNHPFYSDGEWIQAGQLSIGDKILHVDGAEHKVSSIETFDDNIDVYNIEVDGTHNYFAEGYLVHNK